MKIYVADSLNTALLDALFSNELSAVRIPGYFRPDLCDCIAHQLLQSNLLGAYANAPEIRRVGRAFFESVESKELRDKYYAEAVSYIRDMRVICNPYLTPIDQLRLNMDESWPAGATIATHANRKLFVGLVRIFVPGSKAEPHQDFIRWDAPCIAESERISAQLAANVYLSMPPRGGELLIWPKSFSEQEYAAAKIVGGYGLPVQILDCPPVAITPSVGELILFNSQLVHAVTPPIDGNRITASSFIGFRGIDKSLTMWS